VMEIDQHRADDVSQPARDPMAVDGRTDGLTDDQSYSRTRGLVAGTAAANVNDEVWLRCTHPAFDSHVKLGRPPHAVACRKHRPKTRRYGSGRKRAAALTPPAGHDHTARAGPHAQPEAVYAGSAPVVRLEGPLALGHGILLGVSFTKLSRHPAARVYNDSRVGRKVVLLTAGRRGPLAFTNPGRSRIADFRATV
jgi:hypothetical protein